MIWPFSRMPRPAPSAEAVASIHEGARELEEAKELRRESQRLGAALTRVTEENHIAAALGAVIANGGRA